MSETWYPYTQEELVILSKLSGLELAAFLKERYARKWVLPANKTHILLGTPGLLDRHKTLVEPDGSFSPGVGTFGITVWLYHHRDGKLYVAEELPLDELSFTLAKGFLPVACSKWKAKEFCVKIRVFVGGQDNDETKVTDYAEVTVINEGKGSSDAWLYIAIRSLGPAGGPIKNIGYDADKKVVTVNSKPSVHFDIAPESFGATSFAHEEEDISTWARRGELPPLQEIEDSTGLGLASGAARFALRLAAGNRKIVGLRVCVGEASLSADFNPGDVQREMKNVTNWWRSLLLQMQLSIAKPFPQQAFYASIGYLLILSVDNEARLSNISFPQVIQRDAAITINAIDKAGLHDWARRFIGYSIDHLWTGAASQGGPEADAPGALVWVIMEHYRLTHDADWLRSVYPMIKRYCMLIEFLWEAKDGQVYEEGGVRFTAKGGEILASMETELQGIPLKFDVVFGRREGGVFYGRVDLHLQTDWVVPWHIAALRGGWEAAKILGYPDDAQRWRCRYESYRDVYSRLAVTHPRDGHGKLDVWPCRVLDIALPHISDINQKDSYAQLLTEYTDEIDPGRSMSNKYVFFEPAHSLLLMGHREYVLENFLEKFKRSPQSREALDTYALAEVTGPGLKTWWITRHWRDLWANVRGWSNLGFNIPQSRCQASFALLMRHMLFFEWNNTLILAEGILLDNLRDGEKVGVRNAPTYFGTLDYSLQKHGEKILLRIGGAAAPPDGYLLRLSRGMSVTDVSIDGVHQPAVVVKDRIAIPAHTRRVTIMLA